MDHHLAGPALVLIAACTTDVVVMDGTSPVVVTELDRAFDAAGRATGVPADLLRAIGHVETDWQMITGAAEYDDAPPGIGVMALRPDAVGRGAALAGRAIDDVATDPAANILAAAYLLAEEARAEHVSGAGLRTWMPVVAARSGITDADAVAAYVDGDVLRVLATGAEEHAESGALIASLPAHPELAWTPPPVPKAAGADYPTAIWRPSPSYGSRSRPITHVVIHTCEGNYAGCWGWLRNPAAGASAHYVVDATGAEITQLVHEASRAWHVAATYDCSRNGSTDCDRNGVSVNDFAVGIEHAGFGSQASWSPGLIEASARLTCAVTRAHGIARDRFHIVGHGQLQPWNRSDPGPNWPWAHYLERVRAVCADEGSGAATAAIIVDSNGANDDAATARFELAGAWTSASSTSGYYGSGYWWADADTASASFWFYLPVAQTRAIDAWWTAGTNRATTATFVARSAGGVEIGRAVRSQQSSGSQWVALGTWSFAAGWSRIVLTRGAATGKVVIADAIRVR
jgi:hypothetical protein